MVAGFAELYIVFSLVKNRLLEMDSLVVREIMEIYQLFPNN